MPITTSASGSSAAQVSRASISGMVDSAPSRPKRFWPTYLVPRKLLRASAALSWLRMRRWSSPLRVVSAPSICSWIHRFSSGSWMCMYSTPTVRQ